MILKGKVVLVTGAGRGVGRAIALEAAKAGAAVAVNDLGVGIGGDGADAGPAQEVVKEIEAMGAKRVGFGTELRLKRSDFKFDPAAIGNIGDEAIIIIDCAGVKKS